MTRELEETVPGKRMRKVAVCPLNGRVTELAARDHCFSPENQTGPQKPQIAPVWLCVFVPMKRMNCSIIIFLGAAEQPQTRSKTQTDLKLIRSTVLDILPNHQTQDTVEANVNQADVCPEIFLWFHVSRKESWGSAQMKTFLCNQALLASPQ